MNNQPSTLNDKPIHRHGWVPQVNDTSTRCRGHECHKIILRGQHYWRWTNHLDDADPKGLDFCAACYAKMNPAKPAAPETKD